MTCDSASNWQCGLHRTRTPRPHQAPKRVSDCCKEKCPPAALEKSWRAVAGSPEAGEQPDNDLRGHARIELRAIFRRKLRVAILLLVVGVTATGNRDAGKFTRSCRPIADGLPTRKPSETSSSPRAQGNPRQLLTCRSSTAALARPRHSIALSPISKVISVAPIG